MQTLGTIRELLAERGLRPRHALGQNFLHDQNQIRKLVAAAAPTPGELVLEVGPGTGTLTEALVEAGAEVVACELDPNLADIVEERLGDRVRLVRGDCLESKHALSPTLRAALAAPSGGPRPFVLVANLPYNVATPLMALLLTDHPECRGQFVTVQRELAERLMASPTRRGQGRLYGALSVLFQSLATVETISILPPSCFWPAPEVTSAMIAVRRRPDHGIDEPRKLAEFCGRLFATRRKQLGTILGKDHPFPPDIDMQRRPDSLTPEEVVRLWRAAR